MGKFPVGGVIDVAFLGHKVWHMGEGRHVQPRRYKSRMYMGCTYGLRWPKL